MKEGQFLTAPVFPSCAPGNERHEDQGDTHKDHLPDIPSPSEKKGDAAHRQTKSGPIITDEEIHS